MPSIKFLFYFLLIVTFSSSCKSQTTIITDAANTAAEKADKIAQEIFQKEKFPGMAIEVWKNGKTVFSKGYGYADIENRVSVDPSKSQFRIGSVSKPFTAAGLAKLYEESKIYLDAPIQKYVPTFPQKKHKVTLRQLAGHLGGIRHYQGLEFMSNIHYPTVLKGLNIFAKDALINEPGTTYSYSSYGWNLISAAMETAAEEDFLEYMSTQVFQQLGMEYTVADDNTKNIPNKVAFYYRQNSRENKLAPTVDNSYKWAGGGFLSTVHDMARFGQAHIDARFLKKETIDLWTSSQTTSTGEIINYGLGWRCGEDKKGRPWYGHGGGSVGGSSLLLVFPEENLVAAMTINLSQAKYGNLLFRIAEQFFSLNAKAQALSNPKLTEKQWREDLDYLVNIIKTEHLKPYTTVSEGTLDSLKHEIDKNLSSYSEEKIICAFSKLTALLGWGHTRLSLPVNDDHLGIYLGHKREQRPHESVSTFSVLPLRFVRFSDGIYVESAISNYNHLLGKRVSHINGIEIEIALQRIAPYIAHENQSALDLLAPSYLSIIELLYSEGIINSKKSVHLNFQNNEKAAVTPIPYDDKSPWIDYLTFYDIENPLWLKNIDNGMWKVVTNDQFYTEVDQFYWYSLDTTDHSLYVKINYLFHHPDKSLGVFMNEAMQAAAENDVAKIILDLRHNRGGSGDVNRAVKLALQRWPKISEFGNLFVIIGRHTYSASLLLSLDLEKDCNAIFIGEELGGKPQHIGDSRRFRLPNSGLTLRVSVREHHDWTGLPDRSSIWLHYDTPITFSDYKNGIDSALKFAKNYVCEDINAEIISIYKNTNINVALLIFYHLLTDPNSAMEDHSALAFSLAKFLYEEEDNISYAQALLQYNLEYYSTHIPSLLLLAQIQISAGEVVAGKEHLEKILLIDPNNVSARHLLQSI